MATAFSSSSDRLVQVVCRKSVGLAETAAMTCFRCITWAGSARAPKRLIERYSTVFQ